MKKKKKKKDEIKEQEETSLKVIEVGEGSMRTGWKGGCVFWGFVFLFIWFRVVRARRETVRERREKGRDRSHVIKGKSEVCRGSWFSSLGK